MSAEIEVNKSSREKPDEKIVMGDAEVKSDSKTGDTPGVLVDKPDNLAQNDVAENEKNDKIEEKDNEANGDTISEKEDEKTQQKSKKKVNSTKSNNKQSSEDDESAENSEAEDENDDDDSPEEKDVKETKSKTGGRDRKQVQRYSEDAPETKERAEGSGIALGSILSIDNNLGRAKQDDLKAFHKFLFKNLGKTNMIRRNIRKFNGFDFSEDSEQYTAKLATINKMDLKQIKSFCDILGLEKKGSKEDLARHICEFLLQPKDNNIIEDTPDETPSGRPRRSAALKASAKGFSDSEDSDEKGHRSIRGKGQRASLKDETSSESDYNPSGSEGSDAGPKRMVKARGRGRPARTRKAKDSDLSDASDVSEESEDDSDAPPKKRGRVAKPASKSVAKRSPRSTNKKKADSEMSKSEDESAEESDDPKAKRGRPASNSKKTASNRGKKAVSVTPAKGRGTPKRGAAGKKSTQKDSSSEGSEEAEELTESEDEPLSKKGKPQPPSDDELKSLVKEILDGANLEEITMKTVCKQVYAKYPQFDLAHKKEFIKTTVKSLIST